MNNTVGVGLIGSQFICSIHADSLKKIRDAEMVAVMSPTPGHAKKFAEQHNRWI